MSEGLEWAEVLDTIYRGNIVWTPDTDFDSEHPVVSAVETDAETVQENLAMLSQSGLVGRVHVGIKADISRPRMEGITGITGNAERNGTHIGLTARGFHVAHEREMMEQEQEEQDRRIQSQNEINSAIGYLTLGLLFINFVNTWITASVNSAIGTWPLSIWAGLIADAVVIIAIALLLYQSELLEPRTQMGSLYQRK